jgi:hypothetical protein
MEKELYGELEEEIVPKTASIKQHSRQKVQNELALLLLGNNNNPDIDNRVIQLLAGSIGDLVTRSEHDKLQIIFHEGQQGLIKRVEKAEELMGRLEKIWSRVRLALVGLAVSITGVLASGQVIDKGPELAEFIFDMIFGG